MAINLLQDRGTPVAKQRLSWKDMVGKTISKLDAFCDEKLENDSPGFGKIKSAVSDVRQIIHHLLEKKREKEPDPVEVVVLRHVPPGLDTLRNLGQTVPA